MEGGYLHLKGIGYAYTGANSHTKGTYIGISAG